MPTFRDVEKCGTWINTEKKGFIKPYKTPERITKSFYFITFYVFSRDNKFKWQEKYISMFYEAENRHFPSYHVILTFFVYSAWDESFSTVRLDAFLSVVSHDIERFILQQTESSPVTIPIIISIRVSYEAHTKAYFP